MIIRLFLSILTFFCIFLTSESYSADLAEEEIELRPAILRVDYNDLEAIGLFSTPKDGSLGRDLWNNSRRSVLNDLIPALPLPGSSPTHQRLVMGSLLTSANPRLIEDDIEIEPGKDLLTLRLQKLNEMGAYKQSFKIYSALGIEPYHINLAQAGITAMLFNGERSLACLEYKTMEDRDFDSSFWNEIKRYCRYVLTGENKEALKKARNKLSQSDLPTLRNIGKNSQHKVSFSISGFTKISELEKAILVAEDRVIWPKISTSFLKKLPFEQLGIFLARDDLEPSEKFLTLLQTTKRGLTNTSDLSDFYNEIYETMLRQNEGADGLGWKKIAYAFHHAQKTRKNEEIWEHISSALSLTNTYGEIALSPFANIMQTTSIEDQNESTIKKSLRIIKYAGENIPGRWIKHFSDKKNDSNLDRSLHFLSQIWSETPSNQILENDRTQGLLKKNDKKLKLNYFKIIENLDKRKKTIHNAGTIYVNDFDLTFTANYVMPMPRVWDQLVNSSQNKRIGESVLLSTVILQKQNLGELYPGIVEDVLLNFNNVGSTKTYKLLVLELVLEQL